MTFIHKLIYGFKAIPQKIPTGFFSETGKLILKFIWKCKECRRANKSEKEEQSWRTNKTVWDRGQDRQKDQQNRTENPMYN